MKKLFLFAATLACVLGAQASASWTLQSKAYNVDTLFHAKIGPGTTQTSLALSGGSTLKVHYITTDLTNPYVDIRVAQAGSKLTGGAKLSTMSNANTNASSGVEYFAGVNADFFGNSQPIGSTMVNGEVYKAVNSSWINWYMNDAKVPGIEDLTFSGVATGPSASHAVSAINEGRAENYLVVYNSHYAATTGTNAYGAEVLVSPVEGTLGFNGTVKCKVDADPVNGVGSMSIPSDRYVLSGHGTAANFVRSLKAGDEVTISLTANLATGGKAVQMAGGQPIILQNGQTLNTQGALDHLTALNPRTAVGYSADRKKLVLLVVDGRSSSSVGVVSKVLADIMREVGCSDAMNFDGGGSSELYTRAFGVRNTPSDGTERTVVNSVWAVATAPLDKGVAEIAFTAPVIMVPKYGYYVPTFYAYNKYGVLLDTDLKGVQLSCDEALGQVVGDGCTLFANGSGTHKLTATYNGVTTTATVVIGSAAPQMRLESVIVDSFRDYKAEITAKVDGRDMEVDNQAMTWSTADPEVATVTDLGVIHGVADGNTTITAKVDDFSGSLPVIVKIPKNRYHHVAPNADLADWTTTKTSISTIALAKSGDHGFGLDFKVSSTRGTKLGIKANDVIDVYSLPDSLRFVINPGDAVITKIDVTVGANGERPVTASVEKTLTPNVDNIVAVAASEFCDVNDFRNYPLQFSSLAFYLGNAVGYEGHIDVSALQSVHTAVADMGSAEDIAFDGPVATERLVAESAVVARGEAIMLNVSDNAKWLVYNASGAIVATGKGNVVDSALLPTGVLIVATSDGRAERVLVK